MLRHLLLIIFLIASITSSKGQFLDTTGGNIIIREFDSYKELFVIDWQNAYCQSTDVEVKDKLGSYHVDFKKGKPTGEFKIIKFDRQYVLWKNGAAEIQLLLKDVGNKKVELIISSNEMPNHWHIPFYRKSFEEIYGGGIQFSKYPELNKKIINLTQENGIGRGGGTISKWTSLAGVVGESYATYCPLTYFSTNLDRSFQWNEYAYSEVDFHNEYITFDIFENSVRFTLGYDLTMNEVHSVNQPLPYILPDWSLGTILGVQGGTKATLEKLNKLTDQGVEVNALWIQDWVGKQPTKFGSRLNWTWQLDQNHYTQFENFKSDIDQRNIKLLGYVNPFFAKDGPYVEEGKSKSLFIMEENGPKEFEFGGIQGYMIDLFKDDACLWMKEIIQTNLVDQGFSGWMADFAEWYPISDEEGAEIYDLKMHNEYPVIWAQINHEIITENSDKELFFFNRSGGNGTNNYSSMMWAGDQMVDYTLEDGLGSLFDAYLSSSYSGLPMIHSDVGGYTSVKKPFIKNYLRKELLLKDWMLLEAFTPVFRTHEGLLPEDNFQVYSDSAIIQTFKKFSDINHKLLPYFKQLISERNEKGNPIFREVNQTVKGFETPNPGFCVGNQILILHQIEKEDYISLQKLGWKFVNNSGAVTLRPQPHDKIIVAVKGLADIIQ